GTVKNVAGETVLAMKEHFGCLSPDILVGIGPAIGPCCYEVGNDVVNAIRAVFENHAGNILRSGESDRYYLDLWQATRIQLTIAGVPLRNIESGDFCTRCNAGELYSHRHDNGTTGRFAAGIMIKASR
ncbi:MAG: laccase domain-containing protein, partial [Candidatus Zixiibacteriota bacterium]